MLPALEPAADLNALATQLTGICNLKNNPKTSGIPASRARAAMALQAVALYLGEQEGFADLLDPLWALLLAVGDLEAGKCDEMLKPVRPDKGGAPGSSSNLQTIMGHAVVAFDMLIRFRGKTPDEAAREVAKRLEADGFVLPWRKKPTSLPDIIKDWHYRMDTARPGASTPYATKHWATYNKLLKVGVEDSDVQGWFSRLGRVVKARAV